MKKKTNVARAVVPEHQPSELSTANESKGTVLHRPTAAILIEKLPCNQVDKLTFYFSKEDMSEISLRAVQLSFKET
jgi:hypothetical protein